MKKAIKTISISIIILLLTAIMMTACSNSTAKGTTPEETQFVQEGALGSAEGAAEDIQHLSKQGEAVIRETVIKTFPIDAPKGAFDANYTPIAYDGTTKISEEIKSADGADALTFDELNSLKEAERPKFDVYYFIDETGEYQYRTYGGEFEVYKDTEERVDTSEKPENASIREVVFFKETERTITYTVGLPVEDRFP